MWGEETINKQTNKYMASFRCRQNCEETENREKLECGHDVFLRRSYLHKILSENVKEDSSRQR
jgi:hypothetical protein